MRFNHFITLLTIKFSVIFFFVLQANSASTQTREVDLELVLAADISGSMDQKEATLQRDGFIKALRHPDVISTISRGRLGRIALTYIEWAGPRSQNTLVNWREISSPQDAYNFADLINEAPIRTAKWTSISSLMFYAAGRFVGNGYKARRRIIDISGDGPNNSGINVAEARDITTGKRITINGLPIVNERKGPWGDTPLKNLDLYYEDCVIGGQGAFVIVSNGFKDFARAIRRKMILEIAGRQPRPRGTQYADAEGMLKFVTTRTRPPCGIGETQVKEWRLNQPDNDGLLYDW